MVYFAFRQSSADGQCGDHACRSLKNPLFKNTAALFRLL